MRKLLSPLFALALSLLLTGIAAEAKTAKVDQPAPDFTLVDVDGNKHSLSDFKGKYVVLEWVNYDCPFVMKHYGSGNLPALQGEYTRKRMSCGFRSAPRRPASRDILRRRH
jgi:cytochrome oxidase Cu insertion factor (SCO1/SenC/PrrC family)